MKKLLLLSMLLLAGTGMFAQSGFASYVMPDTTYAANSRTCLKIDAAGAKWYGSLSKGVEKFDGTTWTTYNTTTSGLPSNYVTDIAFDAAGNVWFATKTAGIAKFDGSTWTVYNVSNSGLVDNNVNCLFVRASTIWIGTLHGLSEFNGSTWITYTTATSGLVNNNVTALNRTSSGNLWVGTAAGLSVKSTSGWTSYDSNNSWFVSGNVTAIYFESPAVTWVSVTDAGVFKFNGSVITPVSSVFTGKIFNYNLSAVKSICTGPRGGVLFSGINGYYTTDHVPGFYEALGADLYFYPFPAGYACDYNVLEPATNRVWFIKKYSSSFGSGNPELFSFDFSGFTGPSLLTAAASTYLDINQVRATMSNRGDLQWDGMSAGYEVPKGSGRNAIFASSLWMGGVDIGGNLHQAAMTYRQTGNDYWPGPLDTLTGTTDSVTSFNYDKIWKINRSKIEEFQAMFAIGAVQSGSYIPDPTIIDWPARGTGNYSRNLAPFVDVNGDGLYNPMVDGDYPKIKGDQMCYWIFNDNLKPHTETGGAAFKVEVHGSAYAYNCDSITDSLRALNYTTFYDFEVYNRSTLHYSNTFLGIWQDEDLGGYNDDYVGCNKSDNYTFFYNGDSVDEGVSGILGYGLNPPMVSNVILNGPLANPGDGIDNDNDGTVDEAGEKNLMTHAMNYNNNSNPVNGNPYPAADFYNYMQSKWRDGSPVVYGGDGTGTGTPYNFMYDGVPDVPGAPGWSETSLNNPFVDRRILMTAGPFDLDAAAHVDFSYAVVYTRSNMATTKLDLYNQNLADVHRIRQWYDADNFPSCDAVATGIKEVKPSASELLLYPNPATETLYINYKTASKTAVLEMYDVRGALVKQEQLAGASVQTVDVSNLQPGLYIVKIQDGKNVASKKFLKE